jgi:hypothetical protein
LRKYIYKALLIIIVVLFPKLLFSAALSGKVMDTKGQIIPFASIKIDKLNIGINSNIKGKYLIQLPKGTYNIICTSIGYKTFEKTLMIDKDNIELNIILEEQTYELKEVIVQNKSEDPAYQIIREAIKKREENAKQLDNYSCQAYIKGQIDLNNLPKKIMGDTLDFEDGDTSKSKSIFLSETVANYAISKPKEKIEVLSTKVSGNSNGYGLGDASIISFYKNIINLGDGIGPRGFISPIADNALQFYKFKYLGTFYENGKEVNRIKVVPKRKQEPLFTGYINIIEGSWEIYNLKLDLIKEQQLQILDTISFSQVYFPVNGNWMVKEQIMIFKAKIFGIGIIGNFLKVYNQYKTDLHFEKKYFNNVVIKYLDSSNKKSLIYWDSIRPTQLLEKEKKDYFKKDSLEKLRLNPAYLDSLDIVRNKPNWKKILLTGYTYEIQKKKSYFSIDPMLSSLPIIYNSVEGGVANFDIHYTKVLKEHSSININPQIRYGYGDKKFYGSLSTNYQFNTKKTSTLGLLVGNNIFQFNNNNPIGELNNTLSTLSWGHNYMKVYQASILKLNYSEEIGNGFKTSISINYQNRNPLNNIIDSIAGKALTPNFPTDITSTNISKHKSLFYILNLQWTPFSQYMELPDRIIRLSSKYPTFNLTLTKSANELFNEKIDFTKWRLSVANNYGLKIYGRLYANIAVGGFINANNVTPIDYQHYLGDETVLASKHLEGFQLMPYYKFSNTSSFYTESHLEYHLNGFISNKIPLFKKLNWFFIVGANTLNVNNKLSYYESFISLEKVFKIIRIDFVKAYTHNEVNRTGIRISVPLLSL